MPRRIGLIAFDDIVALDLFGPSEVFGLANDQQPGAYQLMIVAASTAPITTDQGLRLIPSVAFADAPDFDTIVIPGGGGLRDPAIAAPIVAFLQARRDTRRVASVCTGLRALAAAGLLDGRRATTHWRFAGEFARLFPEVRIEPDALYLQDGNIFTSAGVTAGIDLALAMVEKDLGSKVSLAVAREMVVYLKRPGGQQQYSEPLRFQACAADRFADLAAWMVTNLDADLSVETLAARVNLSARHFAHRFTDVFGATPAAYVERLRLDKAREELVAGGRALDGIAASVGYAGMDSFRRAFERSFGVPPGAYRNLFREQAAPS